MCAVVVNGTIRLLKKSKEQRCRSECGLSYRIMPCEADSPSVVGGVSEVSDEG
jgi:hypothetical protein